MRRTHFAACLLRGGCFVESLRRLKQSGLAVFVHLAIGFQKRQLFFVKRPSVSRSSPYFGRSGPARFDLQRHKPVQEPMQGFAESGGKDSQTFQ